MATHRIIVVDDHPLVRDALRQAVASTLADAEILEAGSLDELVQTLATGGEVDLVLLDLAVPGVKGFSGLLLLRTEYPAVPVVIVSATEDAQTIRRAMDFGASGFVPKSLPPARVREAVKAVLDGGAWTPPGFDLTSGADREQADTAARLSTLTPQQVRVLMMLGEGLLNKQIAWKLGVSEATIKAHVSAILTKLGVDSRTQAVIALGRITGTDWAAGKTAAP